MPAVGEMDVLPSQREHLAESQPRVRRDPVELGVLAVLGRAR